MLTTLAPMTPWPLLFGILLAMSVISLSIVIKLFNRSTSSSVIFASRKIFMVCENVLANPPSPTLGSDRSSLLILRPPIVESISLRLVTSLSLSLLEAIAIFENAVIAVENILISSSVMSSPSVAILNDLTHSAILVRASPNESKSNEPRLLNPYCPPASIRSAAALSVPLACLINSGSKSATD